MHKDDENEDEGSADDSALRNRLDESGFNPDSGGMKWMQAAPRVLVAGAYKVIRTAAEKARKLTERNR